MKALKNALSGLGVAILPFAGAWMIYDQIRTGELYVKFGGKVGKSLPPVVFWGVIGIEAVMVLLLWAGAGWMVFDRLRGNSGKEPPNWR